jgi:hypothetical protein
MATGYTLDGPSLRRIGRALKTGRKRTAGGGEPGRGSAGAETCYGRLTNRVAKGFEWVEVFPQDDRTYQQKAGGRVGTVANGAALAVELEQGDGRVGVVYLLRRVALKILTPGTGETDWRVSWAIVNPSPYRFGKMVAPWAAGSPTVTLQPVAGAAGTPYPTPPDPIGVNVITPLGAVPAYVVGSTDSIFVYQVIDAAAGLYLLVAPQTTPIPVNKWETLQNVGNDAGHAKWSADILRGANP